MSRWSGQHKLAQGLPSVEPDLPAFTTHMSGVWPISSNPHVDLPSRNLLPQPLLPYPAHCHTTSPNYTPVSLPTLGPLPSAASLPWTCHLRVLSFSYISANPTPFAPHPGGPHTLMVASSEPENTRDVDATSALTALVCPLSTALHSSVVTSHTLTVLS